MIELAKRLYPIARSLTGPGCEQTLRIIGEYLPGLQVHAVASGTQVYGWTVPPEWIIRDAWIETPSGERICQFRQHPLHVVGYSIPIDRTVDLDELQAHLYSLPHQSSAIPYVTSYYKRAWGFCLPDTLRQTLRPGQYRVFIDSELKEDGNLIYGDYVLPGQTDREIIFSTDICHPYMAENETSGMVVVTELARRLRAKPGRFTYRFLFTPETIGAIVYKASREDWQNIAAGCHVYCVGRMLTGYRDMLKFTLGPEPTLADRIARASGRLTRLWTERDSDERQYCHPPTTWPFVALTRGTDFTGYHTSLDTLDLLSESALEEAVIVLERFAEAAEVNAVYESVYPCEPQLSRFDLYPHASLPNAISNVRGLLNVIGACDGKRDLVDVAIATGVSVPFARCLLEQLVEVGQMKRTCDR